MARTQNYRMEAVSPTAADPAVNGVEFADADTVLAIASRGVYIAADGDLECTFVGGPDGAGNRVTFVGLKGGVVYPFAITHIWAAETTTTGVVLL